MHTKISLFYGALNGSLFGLTNTALLYELYNNPQKVVALAASMIEYAGSEQSLREASKLMRIDEHLFGNMVNNTLWEASSRRNPFKLAYLGFEINDSAVDKGIIVWAGEMFGYKDKPDHVRTMALWAEAMAEKYNGEPTAAQLTNDPIISRLSQAEQDSLRDELPRFITDAAQKRTKQ